MLWKYFSIKDFYLRVNVIHKKASKLATTQKNVN